MKQAVAEAEKSGKRTASLSRFLQLPFNTWIFKHLPLWACRVYLRSLGALYFIKADKEAGAVRAALRHCLGRGCRGAGAWPRVKAGIVEHYLEKLYVAHKPYDVMKKAMLAKVRLKGREVLDHALAQGKGVLLVTGHFGAVEFMPGTLAFNGYPLTAMVHCKTPALRRILEKRSSQAKVNLLDPKKGSVVFGALDELKKGRVLLTQCDEIDMWRPHRSRKLDFVGLEVGLDRSMDILAGKSKAPVVFGLVHRLKGGRYEIRLQKPVDPKGARHPGLVSAQCLSMLSREIYRQPEAWYEWKKLKGFLPPLSQEVINAHTEPVRVPDQLGLHPAG